MESNLNSLPSAYSILLACYCHCWNTPLTTTLCSHMQIFFTQRNSILPIPFHVRCHFVTASLLPPVALQQYAKEYWWKDSISTAISPASASEVVGQHDKIGSITFRSFLRIIEYPELEKNTQPLVLHMTIHTQTPCLREVSHSLSSGSSVPWLLPWADYSMATTV